MYGVKAVIFIFTIVRIGIDVRAEGRTLHLVDVAVHLEERRLG